MDSNFRVIQNEAGTRLDVFLKERFPGHSRAFFQSLIKDGSILVNDIRATASRRLHDNDTVVVRIPDEQHALQAQPELVIPVLYEDADVLVINKPAGIVTHPLRMHGTGTVANWAVAYDEHMRAVGDSPLRPGIVHRLDKGTSGVMVLARTAQTFTDLKAAFHDRRMKKEYVALLERLPAKPEGDVEGYIAASRSEHRKKTLSALPIAHESKPSFSHYRVLDTLGPGCRAAFEPATGRTHQIRVHAKALDAPILGDRLYGAKMDLPEYLSGRFYLHARRLAFRLPGWVEERVFVADLPPEFSKAAEWLASQHK